MIRMMFDTARRIEACDITRHAGVCDMARHAGVCDMARHAVTCDMARHVGAWIVIVVCGIAIAGCGSTQTQVRTETVPVMVAVPVDPPAVEVPARPELPISRLDSTSAPRDVMRAYAASVRLLQGYARQLEALLRPYTKRPPSDGND